MKDKMAQSGTRSSFVFDHFNHTHDTSGIHVVRHAFYTPPTPSSINSLPLPLFVHDIFIPLSDMEVTCHVIALKQKKLQKKFVIKIWSLIILSLPCILFYLWRYLSPGLRIQREIELILTILASFLISKSLIFFSKYGLWNYFFLWKIAIKDQSLNSLA